MIIVPNNQAFVDAAEAMMKRGELSVEQFLKIKRNAYMLDKMQKVVQNGR